jgi:hypothetical protein
MLGATCSLKLIFVPVDARNLSIDDENRSREGERRESGASASSSSKQKQLSEANKEACQLTAIMTMIPYQFFVKLLGVMCCICSLKSRACLAMECDLEI